MMANTGKCAKIRDRIDSDSSKTRMSLLIRKSGTKRNTKIDTMETIDAIYHQIVMLMSVLTKSSHTVHLIEQHGMSRVATKMS